LKITLYGVSHLVLSILAIVYGIALRNIFLYSIGLALILIFYKEYKSFNRIRNTASNLLVKRYFDKTIASELDEVAVTITIENKGSDAISRALIIDKVSRYVKPKADPITTISIPPNASISISYRAVLMAPGTHVFNEIVVIVSDFLGYFTEELRYSVREHVVALPLELRVGLDMKSIQKVIGVYVSGKAIGGLFNIANVRDYQPGDSVKKIIWSAYAKTSRLMIREDFGESRARVLLLIDLRPSFWFIGVEPNTLAHIHLRFARSLVSLLLKSGVAVDVAICSGLVPKIITYSGSDIEKIVYRIFSLFDAGSGCESSISAFADISSYIERDASQYSLVLLVTNPIALSLTSPDDIAEIGKIFDRLLIAMPMFRYEEYINRDDIVKLLNGVANVLKGSLIDIDFAEESFEVSYGV